LRRVAASPGTSLRTFLPLAPLLLLVAPRTAPAAVPSADVVRYRILNEALAQAERPSAAWDPGQRDCAGFVRYLFRRATGSQAPLWLRRDGTRGAFVKAEELLVSFVPLERDVSPERVETGDLLAYFDESRPPADAFHLMVLLRPPGTAPGRLLAVYHNGATGPDAAVRKVWVDDLQSGPPEWRPVPGNPGFLGVFRWSGFASSSTKGAPR
jgi:uncharacterized protein